MIGRTPGHIKAVRPLQDGVIADYDVTAEMLRYFVRKVLRRRGAFTGPRIVVCVPSGITSVEQRAVSESAYAAGARRVHIITEPMAAAIGAGLPVNQPSGSMIVDIGGGTTEVAVLALGGIVAATSLRVAGNALDQAIVDHVRAEFSLLDRRADGRGAEDLGRLGLPGGRAEEAEIRGRDVGTGLPRNVTVSRRRTAQGDGRPDRPHRRGGPRDAGPLPARAGRRPGHPRHRADRRRRAAARPRRPAAARDRRAGARRRPPARLGRARHRAPWSSTSTSCRRSSSTATAAEPPAMRRLTKRQRIAAIVAVRSRAVLRRPRSRRHRPALGAQRRPRHARRALPRHRRRGRPGAALRRRACRPPARTEAKIENAAPRERRAARPTRRRAGRRRRPAAELARLQLAADVGGTGSCPRGSSRSARVEGFDWTVTLDVGTTERRASSGRPSPTAPGWSGASCTPTRRRRSSCSPPIPAQASGCATCAPASSAWPPARACTASSSRRSTRQRRSRSVTSSAPARSARPAYVAGLPVGT